MREVNGRRWAWRDELRAGDQIRVYDQKVPVERRPVGTESWTIDGFSRDGTVLVLHCEMGVQVPVEFGEEVELVSRASERRAAAAGGRR